MGADGKYIANVALRTTRMLFFFGDKWSDITMNRYFTGNSWGANLKSFGLIKCRELSFWGVLKLKLLGYLSDHQTTRTSSTRVLSIARHELKYLAEDLIPRNVRLVSVLCSCDRPLIRWVRCKIDSGHGLYMYVYYAISWQGVCMHTCMMGPYVNHSGLN